MKVLRDIRLVVLAAFILAAGAALIVVGSSQTVLADPPYSNWIEYDDLTDDYGDSHASRLGTTGL